MIYRHYNGGLYYVIGYATRFSKEFPAKSIEQVAMATLTESKTNERVAVLIVHDVATGGRYYALGSDKLHGVYAFYKDTYGNYWLRPREMFHSDVSVIEDTDGTLRKAEITDVKEEVFDVPRFEKVKGEHLFDIISKKYQKNT